MQLFAMSHNNSRVNLFAFEFEGVNSTMDHWKLQLRQPQMRKYDPISKHSSASHRGRRGSIMDLKPTDALRVLRAACFDPAYLERDNAPSLWAFENGGIYRFMFDNDAAWHGYPAQEKPPNAVLQRWRNDGTITEAEYGKIRRLPNRGN